MKSHGAMHIFHLKLGGGERHRLAICAFAIVAAKNGWKVLPTDKYVDEIPDLIIEKQDRFSEGARRRTETMRYRIEVIDTHDPVPDYKPGDGGYTDCIKVLIRDADTWCSTGHLVASFGHPLCIDGLFWLCERSLP